MLFMISFPGMVFSQADWKNDFKYQQLKNRPDLEVTKGKVDDLLDLIKQELTVRN